MELITRFWRLNRLFLTFGVAPAVLCVGLVCLTFSLFDIVINITPSMPYGFYRAVGGLPSVGDLVYVNASDVNIGVARDRGYVVGETLIKYIVGEAGNDVSISDKGVAVNGVLIKNSMVLSHDPAGREIPYSARNGEISKGAFWVMSDYNELSFDSRYFGEVPVAAVRSKAKPFLTW